MAVLPGVTLDELWQVLSVAENALLLVGVVVSLASLLSVCALVLAGLAARRREFSILRAVGLSPVSLMRLVVVETLAIAAAGLVVGVVLHQVVIGLVAETLRQNMGIDLQLWSWPEESWMALTAMLVSAGLVSLVPAWRVYQWSLSDGLSAPQV